VSDLFEAAGLTDDAPRPLADRLRPETIEDVVGQDHLLSAEGPIGRMLAQGRLASLILWGPPGTGKTTIARLLAKRAKLDFERLYRNLLRCKGSSRRLRESRRPPGDRQGHAPFCRRDPSLQPRPAGRLPAVRRTRRCYPRRRYHRKPQLRTQLGAPVTRTGDGAETPG